MAFYGAGLIDKLIVWLDLQIAVAETLDARLAYETAREEAVKLRDTDGGLAA